MVDGRPVGTGSGRSKKHAEQQAARMALEMLEHGDEDESVEDEE
jgi:dsRNA-specific ribonuclease